MGVAGAPERAKNHAELIMDMAMDMRDSVCFVKDPRPGTDTHIKIRLGSHSGQVVGGIVGNKCPRYLKIQIQIQMHRQIRNALGIASSGTQ